MNEAAKTDVYELRQEYANDFTDYSEISISFSVERVLVAAPDLGSNRFLEVSQSPVFAKDYDSEPGNHPTDWPERFDTSGWAVISAWSGTTRVGGIVVAHGNDDVDMLDGRSDLAVIWDLRVSPERRGRGVGTLLLQAADDWAQSRGCRELKVETQNINVPACAFYERSGFRLGQIDPHAYPELPTETQMLWYKRIRIEGAPSAA